MTPRSLRDLARRLGAEIYADPDAIAAGFATDSREVCAGDIFLAIVGERSDGHEFVAAAQSAGVVASLVERPVGAPHLLVRNLVDALARMASSFRDEFEGPVVGITGSVGKTTAKEFVAAALAPAGPVLKNPGNRNTEYTSPLVWADLKPTHRTAVVEMGMRGFGQIAHLASFSRPGIGLVTNVGHAHLELVGSREGIAAAKGELLRALPRDGLAILWQNDEFLDALRSMSPPRSATFGLGTDADCSLLEYRTDGEDAATVEGNCYGVPWRAKIPHVGRRIAVSAAAAVLTAVEAGVSVADAAAALCEVRLPPMRMQSVLRKGVYVLLDTYNASPPSMIAALEFLSERPIKGRRRAVIGEMRELGGFSETAHRDLGREPVLRDFDAIMFYGDPTRLTMESAIEMGIPATHLTMATSIEDVRNFVNAASPGDAILIKGSRALELERAIE